MSRGPAVQVQGAREVRRTLRKLGEGTRDMTATHRKVAALVLGPATARTRHQSGELAGSYRVRASAAKATIVSRTVYAGVQEFGWPRRGITPSLALSGALDQERGAIADAYERDVAALVARLQATGTA